MTRRECGGLHESIFHKISNNCFEVIYSEDCLAYKDWKQGEMANLALFKSEQKQYHTVHIAPRKLNI